MGSGSRALEVGPQEGSEGLIEPWPLDHRSRSVLSDWVGRRDD